MRHAASFFALVCAGALGTGTLACGSQERAPEAGSPKPRVEVPLARANASTSASCAANAGEDVKLSRDVVPIFMGKCSGEYCHGTAMTTASRAHAFLVGQPSLECDDMRPLVTPGDPSKSYVVDKMLGRNMCSGHPMPRGLANALSEGELALVTEWICGGARED
jgi:hypothetical protein